MISLKGCISSLMLGLMVIAFFSAHAQSSNPQQTLHQYVADLQKNPTDTALREKIIRHVQTMKPAPAIPLEAEKFEGQAEFAIKNAKIEADFLDAAKEYEKAVLIAPWVPAYYFNKGIAYEKAGKPREAKQSFEFYLLGNPNAQDSRDVRKRIAGLEYAMEKAVKESSPLEVAAKQQKDYEDWLRKIDGRRYRDSRGGKSELKVSGKFIVITAPGVSLGPWDIKGRRAATPRVLQPPPLPVQVTYLISEDGDRIIEHRDFSDGDSREFVWVWQR